jgi:hypothetical protein
VTFSYEKLEQELKLETTLDPLRKRNQRIRSIVLASTSFATGRTQREEEGPTESEVEESEKY